MGRHFGEGRARGVFGILIDLVAFLGSGLVYVSRDGGLKEMGNSAMADQACFLGYDHGILEDSFWKFQIPVWQAGGAFESEQTGTVQECYAQAYSRTVGAFVTDYHKCY